MIRLLLCLLSFLPLTCLAETPHTLHDINVAQGAWHGRLTVTSAAQDAFFLKESGEKVGQTYDFDLAGGERLTYGLGFNLDNTDFNVSYTLTLYEKGFTEKACVYVVTAKGPAVPDIRVESYNGAHCDYKKGRQHGRDFFID